jgi:DNA-binding MarR family transcriptional regulator
MKLDLDRYVPGLLLWLSNKMASSASSLYRARFDMGVADWRVLSYFEIYPWSTASSACDLMGLDKAAVSRSVALLQERGFLKSRPLGLRKIEYATTPAGKKQHDRIIRLATAREEALLTGFSPEERAALIGYLNRMLANLDAVRDVGRDSGH